MYRIIQTQLARRALSPPFGCRCRARGKAVGYIQRIKGYIHAFLCRLLFLILYRHFNGRDLGLSGAQTRLPVLRNRPLIKHFRRAG